MSWSCRYEINGYCHLLFRDCEPTIPGCVLHKKYIRAIDLYPDNGFTHQISNSKKYIKDKKIRIDKDKLPE